MNNWQTLLLSLTTIVGLIVLIALGDVTDTAGLPIIAGVAGVHIGANVASPTNVTNVTGNVGGTPRA